MTASPVVDVYDDLIQNDTIYAKPLLYYSEQEAEEKNLIIDHDDSHAARPDLQNNSFALLIHGIQPKGSEAANALQILKRNKVKHSYNQKVKV